MVKMALKTHALEHRGHTSFCVVILTEETIIIIHMGMRLHGLDTMAFMPSILTDSIRYPWSSEFIYLSNL